MSRRDILKGGERGEGRRKDVIIAVVSTVHCPVRAGQGRQPQSCDSLCPHCVLQLTDTKYTRADASHIITSHALTCHLQDETVEVRVRCEVK